MKRTTAVLTSMLLSALIMSGCKNDVDVQKPTSETENENTEQPSNPEQPDTPIQTDANAIISKITTASPAEKEALLNSINSIDFLANHGIQISLDGEGKFSVALPQNLKYNVAVAKHDDKVDIYKTVKAADDEKNKIPAKAKEAVDGCTLPDAVTCIDNNELSILKPLICAAIENANWNNMTYTPEYKDGNIDCKFENLYLKMSDMDALLDGKEDGAPILSSADGNVVISAINKGASETHNGSSMALKIEKQENTSFHIDLSNISDEDNSALTKYYRGGFVFNDISNITFEKPERMKTSVLNSDDFKDGEYSGTKSILNIWDNNEDVLKATRTILFTKNLYGIKGIESFEDFLEKCYKNNVIIAAKYDAYDALPADVGADNQKHMFDNSNNIFSSAPTLSAKAAAAILSGGGTLANVHVLSDNDLNFTMPKTANAKIVNVQFNTDMSNITAGNLKAYGVVKFNNLPPRALNSDQDAKVILNKKLDGLNKETFKVDTLDVSTIPAPYNTLEDMKYFNSISSVLFVSETHVSMERQQYTRIYIGDKYYKAASDSITHTNYTNISREKYAYEAVIKSNTNKNILKRSNENLVRLNDDATSIPATSRVNNIKLTPVQKLLLDDQHIYG